MPVSAGYTEQLPHSGSAEVLFTGLFDEPAGTVARTVPRSQVSQGGLSAGTTGTPNARLIPLPAGLIVSNIAVCSGSTAEVGGQHFWAALTDLLGNVLAVTADQTGGTYVTASTFLKNPVTIPYQVPQTGNYYLVVSISAGTTMPTLAGASNVAGGLVNQAPALGGTFGAQAAPPALGASLGALTPGTPNNIAFWVS